MQAYEKLGLFYLGRIVNTEGVAAGDSHLLYDAKDLVTHAVCVGMTGSGKTGLCIDLLEEAAIDGVPSLVIDPKGDLGNLLLTFPTLSADEFRPWIDEEEARRHDKSPDEWAAAQADTWKQGLADWEQDGERIRRLKEAADFAIYTPGSQAGLPLSILKSFSAPASEFVEDDDLMRERVSTTATSLLGLVGIDADPVKSRDHILLSTIIDLAWRQRQDLTIASLIQLVQMPPMQRIGVLELEAFYPADKRFELAMALNNLLAAPGFSAWMEGEPLDVQRLLFTAEGKPRVSILSIAHLNDAERMFFVTLLFNQVLGWMRQQPGTTSLRAIVYMDEIAGYLPPVAVPASKAPLLTLLKQARAFGVGIVLATQNPVDLDYKALSNAGTWLIGRLQTVRDQARLVDGLAGAISNAGGAFDRETMARIISGVGKRQFLLHNVHDDRPEVFESRWAMSYLRGPLTRAQIKTLMAGRKSASGATGATGATGLPSRSSPAFAPQASEPRYGEAAFDGNRAKAGAAAARPAVSAHWVLPPDIPQYFAPAPDGATFEPVIVGAADVRFTDAKMKVDVTRQVTVVTPLTSEAIPVDWGRARAAEFDPSQLLTELPARATFRELPGPASKAKNYGDWSKSFVTWLSRKEALEIYRSPSLGLVSTTGESEGDFRVRLQQAARERRDDEVTRLRQKYAPKVAALEERRRRAEQAVQKEQQQASDQKTQTAISIGASVIGALFGRKTLSASNVGRAATAARGIGRVARESQDIARAEQNVAAIQESIDELESAVQTDIAAIDATYHPQTEPLQTVALKPKRTGIHVRLVALAWVPHA
jgi:phage host-nuclease inhibitor protein Gam